MTRMVQAQYKSTKLGYFDDPEAAAAAYLEKMQEDEEQPVLFPAETKSGYKVCTRGESLLYYIAVITHEGIGD